MRVLSGEASAAISLLARHEGILLDPVYSGKAFAGTAGLCYGKGSSRRTNT